MRKYDSYKDSGIEWIGEIPSHWETKRIRHIADIFGRIGYRGYTVEDIVFDETGAISLSPSNIENQKLTLESVTRITEEKYEESPEIMVYENDVVLVKTASVGKAAIVKPLNDLATINPQLVVFKNYRIDQTFFYYEIIPRIIQEQITQDLNGGVVNTITQTNLNNYSIIFPQPEEQTAIAHYLDRKTAEIDELITDKKRLLELYEEEKTAIINQAVTKGINPDVPMKDSGIEWLGEIPEHWEVKRVKHVLKSLNSIRVPLSADERGKMIVREYDYYGASGIIDKVEDYLFDEPLLLIGEDGANLVTRSTRLSFIARGKYWVNNHAHILKPTFGLLEYYCELMELCDYSNWISGSAQPKLTSDKLMNIQIVVPPIDEQESIVKRIETQATQIDSKKAKTEKLIELLTEYRTALISEVVTGKIRIF